MIHFLFVLFLYFASSTFAGQPNYVNLKTQFKSFVEKAKDRDFESQIELWQSEVESALPKVYSELLSQRADLTLEQNRRERATKWFPFMFANADKILAQFETFDKDGWPMAERLVANYPQVNFSDVSVIAMPSLMMFNGQVRTLDGQMVAMFGMDFLQLVDENPKLIEGAHFINNTSVMVAHEFTHVLYRKILDANNGNGTEYGLFSYLWNEGLAQMHSQMLVPGTDLAITLMEHNLAAKCTASQVTSWAAMYLKDSQALSEAELKSHYSKWFLMNDWKTLGVARAGYCLSYHTVLSALREHSFNELLYMKPSDASIAIKNALNYIAGSK